MKSLSYLKGHIPATILAPCLKVVECICELVVPFLVKAIIDNGLSEDGSHFRDASYILTLSSIILALSFLGFGATMVTQYVASKVSCEFGYRLRDGIYKKMNAVSSLQLQSYGKAKALNLLSNDSFSLQNGLFMFMRLLVRAPFLTLGSIVASFILNVYAGIAVVCALALCAAVVATILLITPKRYKAIQSDLDKINLSGGDAISGARVIRSFNKQESSSEGFVKLSESYRSKSNSLARVNAFLNPLTFGLVNLAIVAIFYLGSYHFDYSGLSVGSIVAIMSLLTQSLTSLIQFSRLVTSLSKAYASKVRIDGFLTLPISIVSGDKDLPEVKMGETLFELKHASVSYGGESRALDGIDFHLDRGERIGILGGTGSGKSTLIGLLMRFLDPSEGEVLYGGVNLKELKLEQLRAQVGLVLQNKELFKGTIRDNICLGREYSEQQIKDALCIAQAEEFVSGYSDWIDHEVEEGGANFSGGQKQRLLIARAVLSHRSILILDDSTSALDYKTDAKVRSALSQIEGASVLLISQRATSIKDCDRIYVLDGGKLVGVGKHDELLSSCRVYRETFEAQVN